MKKFLLLVFYILFGTALFSQNFEILSYNFKDIGSNERESKIIKIAGDFTDYQVICIQGIEEHQWNSLIQMYKVISNNYTMFSSSLSWTRERKRMAVFYRTSMFKNVETEIWRDDGDIFLCDPILFRFEFKDSDEKYAILNVDPSSDNDNEYRAIRDITHFCIAEWKIHNIIIIGDLKVTDRYLATIFNPDIYDILFGMVSTHNFMRSYMGMEDIRKDIKRKISFQI
jgi:hypothetical protein